MAVWVDNNHKNDYGQSSPVHLMLHVQFMYKLCYGDILYILIEHIMYLILIINQNLILCDHGN